MKKYHTMQMLSAVLIKAAFKSRLCVRQEKMTGKKKNQTNGVTQGQNNH